MQLHAIFLIKLYSKPTIRNLIIEHRLPNLIIEIALLKRGIWMLEKTILDILNRERDDSTPLVVVMCGIAGSGKTTFSQKLEKEVIDEEVWSTNGRYGNDYPTKKYREYLDEAHLRLRNKLVKLIHDKQQVVVDSSFWRGSERDVFK